MKTNHYTTAIISIIALLLMFIIFKPLYRKLANNYLQKEERQERSHKIHLVDSDQVIPATKTALFKYVFPASSKNITLVSSKKESLVFQYNFLESDINKNDYFNKGIKVVNSFESQIQFKNSIFKLPKTYIVISGGEEWSYRVGMQNNQLQPRIIFPWKTALNLTVSDLGAKNSVFSFHETLIVQAGFKLKSPIGEFSNCIKLRKENQFIIIACEGYGPLEITDLTSKNKKYSLSKIE